MKLARHKRSPYWYASFSVRIDGEHKQIRTSTKQRDRAVARQVALRLQEEYRLREIERGIVRTATVNDFLLRIEAHARSTMQERTYRALRAALGKLKAYADRPIQSITPEIADRIVAEMAVRLKPRTVNMMAGRLRYAFRIAVRWELVMRNPFDGVTRISVSKDPPRSFSEDELRRLFVSIQTLAPEYFDLFQFYLHTGMRRSEALQLRWSDVDFERGYIRLMRTKGRRWRDVPLLVPARKILERRRHFSRPFDLPSHRVERALNRCAAAAGVKDAKIHAFRRTFVTMMLNLGIPLYAIQQWVGHIDSETTTESYAGKLERYYEEARAVQLLKSS